MSRQKNYFISFKESIEAYVLPERFTYPFYYQPHPLCQLAAKELQKHLKTQQKWQHNFGLTGNTETAIGKMFGVLLVKNSNNEIGYLAAFSGKLAESNHLPEFVPPIFDMLTEDGFYPAGQLTINQLNKQIETLQNNPQILQFEQALEIEIESSKQQIQRQREKIIYGRKIRKAKRLSAEIEFNQTAFQQLKEQLSRESIQQKKDLKKLNSYWHHRIQQVADKLNQLNTEISILKKRRKDLSAALQQKLFDQYRFLNIKGEEKNLRDIFKQTARQIPPAGSGECAAPKLLQYAFLCGMKPLAMAEFWWGVSPKSEIRKHKNFYPACHGKCQPILEHMLKGIELDDNPLLSHCGSEKSIKIVYQDNTMLVINKPEGLLSIPGKDIEDSVYLRIKQSYPDACGSLMVHRLDMSTSGLMLIALNKEAHKKLQKQFIKRSIKKRYIAILDGLLTEDSGVINLPLRVDLDDRPRQLVCYKHGKSAITRWEIIERKNNQSRVYFYPVTGRTHQLRVHSAHQDGLNTPISGDDLYGNKASRLYLHAESIEFIHPETRELMHFEIEPEF